MVNDVRANTKMHRQLESVCGFPCVVAAELLAIATAGFVEKGDCLLMVDRLKFQTNARRDSFEDAVGYECFVNSIRISDFVHDDHLLTALRFVEECFSFWRQQGWVGELIALVLGDEDEITVKFHRWRQGESWLDDDLEDYPESVLELSSADSSFGSRI